jgi:hypothetical protein
MTWVRQILTSTAVAGTIIVGTATAAGAGIYTWKHVATYKTAAECEDAGPDEAAKQDADTWRCTTSADGVKLYLGYIW